MTNQVQMFSPYRKDVVKGRVLTSVCGAMVEDFADNSTFEQCNKKSREPESKQETGQRVGKAKEQLAYC